MANKPTTAAGYEPGQLARVKATCLYLATKLGDLMSELVVVGGVVPSLLIDQESLAKNVTAHVGTMDLDLGLAFEHAEKLFSVTRLWRLPFSDQTHLAQPCEESWRECHLHAQEHDHRGSIRFWLVFRSWRIASTTPSGNCCGHQEFGVSGAPDEHRPETLLDRVTSATLGVGS